MDNFLAYKIILNHATNQGSLVRPNDINLSRELGVFLFGEQAVAFTKYHKYNGIDCEICLGVGHMQLLYGDYDVERYR